MAAAGLYDEEERLLRETLEFLSHRELPEAEGRVLLRLTEAYRRLLAEARQIVRHADRQERELRQLNQHLDELNHTLAYQARHDMLTGLLNRAAMTETVEQALVRDGGALILVDVDHFKRVNDSHGHPAGDTVLKGVGALLGALPAERAVAGRMGGEEFAILLRAGEAEAARQWADELREAVAEARHRHLEKEIAVTASFGVTPCHAGESFKVVYERADAALYQAKETGRNRVVVFFCQG